MAVFLVKAIFFVLILISNILLRVVFTALSHVVVQVIQVVKMSRDGSQLIFEKVKDGIRAFFGYMVHFVVHAISSIIYFLINLVMEGVVSLCSAFVDGVFGLLEKMEGLLEELPELWNAFADDVGTIVTDFLGNYTNFVSHILNILSRVVFTALSHVVVPVIQAVKMSGDGDKLIFEKVKDGIRAVFDYMVDFVVQAISSIISFLINLVTEGVTSLCSAFAEGVFVLVEKMKGSLEELPGLLNAFAEGVVTIVTDFLSNCTDYATKTRNFFVNV